MSNEIYNIHDTVTVMSSKQGTRERELQLLHVRHCKIGGRSGTHVN